MVCLYRHEEKTRKKGEGEGERERERRGEKKGERDREKKRMRYHKYNSYYKIITEITNTLHIVVIVSLLKASHHATNGAETRNKVYTLSLYIQDQLTYTYQSPLITMKPH